MLEKESQAISDELPPEYRKLALALLCNGYHYYLDHRATGPSLVCCKHRDEAGQLYGPCYWVVKTDIWTVHTPGGDQSITLRSSDYIDAIIDILEASDNCMRIGIKIYDKYSTSSGYRHYI